jgi:hypothetical protein
MRLKLLSGCRGAAALQLLNDVLNNMHANKLRLADRYQLHGPEHRSTGSHGLVQLATECGTSVSTPSPPPLPATPGVSFNSSCTSYPQCCFFAACIITWNSNQNSIKHVRSSKSQSAHVFTCMQEKVAIKLFIDAHAFATEQHLYSLDSLKPHLVAPIIVANTNGLTRSPRGYIFPPHTVAEEGEPLEEWMAGTNSADVITCVQVRRAACFDTWNELMARCSHRHWLQQFYNPMHVHIGVLC